jgi:hypothetical protein
MKTTIETGWMLLQKLKIELPHYPAIPHLGTSPKECKSDYNKDTCTSMFVATLVTIPKLWKQPAYPSTNEWIRKMWYL